MNAVNESMVTKGGRLRMLLRKKILGGEWSPGQRLPTEREISQEYDLSRLIVREALAGLALEGLIERIQGSGTYVAEQAQTPPVKPLVLLYPVREEIGLTTDPYRMQLVDGINQALSSSAQQQLLTLCPLRPGQRLPERIPVRRWREELAGGLLLHPGLVNAQEVSQLQQAGVELASVGRADEFPELSFADIDNLAGMDLAMTHLLELGHERIALVNGPRGANFFADRLQGYLLKLRQYGLAEDPALCLESAPWDRDGARAGVRELLKKRVPFTALLCCGAPATLGAIEALTGEGKRIPEDVSVLSYGYYPEQVSWSGPALTSVPQPVFRLGYESAQVMMQLKATGATEAVGATRVIRRIIRPEFRPGGSCCPPSQVK